MRCGYLPERSLPLANRYVFVCSVRIENEGLQAAQVRSHHWIITSSMGNVAHLHRVGVAGKQPLLRPGEHFEYSTQCVLTTPSGELRGTFLLQRPNGHAVEAIISPFKLAPLHSVN